MIECRRCPETNLKHTLRTFNTRGRKRLKIIINSEIGCGNSFPLTLNHLVKGYAAGRMHTRTILITTNPWRTRETLGNKPRLCWSTAHSRAQRKEMVNEKVTAKRWMETKQSTWASSFFLWLVPQREAASLAAGLCECCATRLQGRLGVGEMERVGWRRSTNVRFPEFSKQMESSESSPGALVSLQSPA